MEFLLNTNHNPPYLILPEIEVNRIAEQFNNYSDIVKQIINIGNDNYLREYMIAAVNYYHDKMGAYSFSPIGLSWDYHWTINQANINDCMIDLGIEFLKQSEIVLKMIKDNLPDLFKQDDVNLFVGEIIATLTVAKYRSGKDFVLSHFQLLFIGGCKLILSGEKNSLEINKIIKSSLNQIFYPEANSPYPIWQYDYDVWNDVKKAYLEVCEQYSLLDIAKNVANNNRSKLVNEFLTKVREKSRENIELRVMSNKQQSKFDYLYAYELADKLLYPVNEYMRHELKYCFVSKDEITFFLKQKNN